MNRPEQSRTLSWEGWEQELAVPTAAGVTRDTVLGPSNALASSRGSSCFASTVLVSNTGPGTVGVVWNISEGTAVGVGMGCFQSTHCLGDI